MEAPVPDGLHVFWLKKVTSLQQALVKHLDGCIQTEDVPKWMVESQAIFMQKDARGGMLLVITDQ